MKLFDKKMMEYRNDLSDWKDVVCAGVDLLVKNKYATKELADAVFESTEQYGAYYVLEKGLALVHAKPGPYALKPGTSTLILDRYVKFNNQDDKEAKIIITLSAIDSTSHISIIQEFGEYFTDENFKKQALACESLQSFVKLLDNYKGGE
ncbi:ascorbate-specific PTS system enzyme II Ccomponent [Mycoplasmopsis californica]|uniref:Ascorbate-specific PTS system EIIA component n=1 Tax=Mycoplasmopsis equigenitalium TaxID=114883 RepID=A0ABY5J104_9BACT|nr:PTS sugar transporter subunit IIA [Mycoplasmopsis equigenitalium]UUD36929.1 PTS sugar transporter subunit IIA [Mycoplasmopsis equigenitalium]VEU69776.1 ascorbate-specific PTS system enzyme II Ccomponent [Mycoplasmopsis californica]